MSEESNLSAIISRLDSIEHSLENINHSLSGNGRPGIIEAVAKQQAMIEIQQVEITAIRKGNNEDRKFVLSSVVLALFSVVGVLFNMLRGN